MLEDAVLCTWHASILTCACNSCHCVMAEVLMTCSLGSVWPSSLPASPCMQASSLPLLERMGVSQKRSDRWCMPESCPSLAWEVAKFYMQTCSSGECFHVLHLFIAYYVIRIMLCIFPSPIQYALDISGFATWFACFIIHYFASGILVHTSEQTNWILLLDWLEKCFVPKNASPCI